MNTVGSLAWTRRWNIASQSQAQGAVHVHERYSLLCSLPSVDDPAFLLFVLSSILGLCVQSGLRGRLRSEFQFEGDAVR